LAAPGDARPQRPALPGLQRSGVQTAALRVPDNLFGIRGAALVAQQAYQNAVCTKVVRLGQDSPAQRAFGGTGINLGLSLRQEGQVFRRRLEGDGLREYVHRPLRQSLVVQVVESQFHPHLCVFRIQCDDPFLQRQGLVVPLLKHEVDGQTVQRPEIFGVLGQDLSVQRFRPGEVSLPVQLGSLAQ
jgi:hypothetical protein